MPAKTHRAWSGALEFAGFPVNVALWSRVKKQRTESFKTIGPDMQPISSKRYDSTGHEVTQTFKGVERSKGEYVAMTPEALELIDSGSKTKVAKPMAFVPREQVPLDLAIDRFAVLPDDKVAGSEQATMILWNGLRSRDLAYVSVVSLRGGHDGVLVVYADSGGMWGALLPFEDELYLVPNQQWDENQEAEALFGQVVDQQYGVVDYDHASFESEYRPRRAAAIQSVLDSASPLPQPAPAAPVPTVPDLMSVLKAHVEATA